MSTPLRLMPPIMSTQVSNGDSDLARQGRENFERQTARMREEARALRMGPHDNNGPGAYFVSLVPRAEFLTEEAMATTLRRPLACGLPRVPLPRQAHPCSCTCHELRHNKQPW